MIDQTGNRQYAIILEWYRRESESQDGKQAYAAFGIQAAGRTVSSRAGAAVSVVTGVTIISQSCNQRLDELIQKLNQWIANDPPCGGGRLFQVDQHYGGGKHPENLVWGGGFNYLSWREFKVICRRREDGTKELA